MKTKFLLALLLFPLLVFCQYKVEGRLVSGKEGVGYTTIKLTVVKGGITDEKGNFRIEGVGKGEYLLEVV